MDASVSLLPLMEGLYHKQAAAQAICNDAYERHMAATRIATWVGRQWRGRSIPQRGGNARKRRKVVVKKTRAAKRNTTTLVSTISKTQSSPSWQHWIFQALRSDSKRVRQVSYAILLRCMRPRLGHVLLDQANFMLTEPPLALEGNDYGIQLVVMLTHLQVQEPTDLVAFCASGGLRWISSSILKLAAELVPTVQAACTTTNQTQEFMTLPHGSLVTIQARIILLVDLCYRLVLYASAPSKQNNKSSEKKEATTTTTTESSSPSKRKRSKSQDETMDEAQKEALNQRVVALRKVHNVLWTSQLPAVTWNDASLTPLACLICVHEVLKANVFARSTGMDKCLSMLNRLVDPKTQVIVTYKDDTNGKNKKRDKRKKPKLRRRTAAPSFMFGSDSSNERSTSAAAEMARAVSDAMDLMDNDNNESSQETNDVVMQDVDENNNDEDEEWGAVGFRKEKEDDDEDDNDEELEGLDDDDDEEEEEEDAIDSDECDECEEEAEDEAEQKEDEEQDLENADEEEEEDLTQETDDGMFETSSPLEQADKSELALEKESQRKHAYVDACMQVLAAHYPHSSHNAVSGGAPVSEPSGSSRGMKRMLTNAAEQSLLKSVCDVVKPPRKRVNFKIYMKRAPTQEEFFRGSISRNPMSFSSLAKHGAQGEGASGHEPTVRDLRQHIANDLQMSDSAELLELLVANKILDMNLKLRVVHQVLWKNHLIEDPSSSFASSLLSGHSGHTFLTSGTSISVVLNATMGRDGSGGRRSVTADTPASALPPMVVTYRLAGVDGEATEDHVDEATLVDPEAPSPMESAEAKELKLEKEYGITRLVVKGRGINLLLRSVEANIMDVLRRIRRDDAVAQRAAAGRNPVREKFLHSAPSSGLMLLSHCSKLSHNRKKLLEARAPTLLLRLLLDVLSALEGPSEACAATVADGVSNAKSHTVSNPTADALKELIEMLSSDISPSTLLSSTSSCADDDLGLEEQDASTLPLLLSSLKTTYLSPPLRKVIGKLLPFLTYGQVSLSRDLAQHIAEQLTVENLLAFIMDEASSSQSSVMMDTLIQATIHLPPSDICSSLRTELLDCGFVERLCSFCIKDIPSQPPPWSPALWSKEQSSDLSKRSEQRKSLEDKWRAYFDRIGLQTGFKMLTGLCSCHEATQILISSAAVCTPDKSENGETSLLAACHWIESTSDNSASKVNMNGMGILAETLLDELKDGNKSVSEKVSNLRSMSRERKKEIATERRSRALVSMNSFGAGGAVGVASSARAESDRSSTGGVMDVASSILAPVLGFFQSSSSAEGENVPTSASQAGASETGAARTGPAREENKPKVPKPAWLAEMEAMEDETGLTCAVCQEGRKLQPTELLGLYTFVKKVSPPSQSGGPAQIDGSMLLSSLPLKLPSSLRGTHVDHEYFTPAKEVARSLRTSRYSSASSMSQSKRPNHFVTTVSAGNAIHCTCHARARSADRNHPKAPKSEWEGAALRNSRVSCNAIMPLVSSKSSKVHLAAVEIALTDYQTVISNLLGSRPKSMLWTILHDIRFLLLRMAYGEALNTDCGGGSLSSNSMLLFHEMFMVDMFANDAEHDSPETAQHARFLSGGFIAAYEIVNAEDFDKGGSSTASSLARNIADAAPMAALCCVLFNNDKDDDATVPGKERRWEMHKEKFLCGLISCAGRRHALGIDESGCLASRGSRPATRMRSSSFADWDVMETEESPKDPSLSSSKRKPKSVLGKRGLPEIDDFAAALRPFITFYAVIDQLSDVFKVEMDDDAVEEGCTRLVAMVESCQRSKSIHELLQKAKVTLDHERIIEELQKGIVSA